MLIFVSLINTVITVVFFSFVVPVSLTFYISYRNKKRFKDYAKIKQIENDKNLMYIRNELKKEIDESIKRINEKA